LQKPYNTEVWIEKDGQDKYSARCEETVRRADKFKSGETVRRADKFKCGERGNRAKRGHFIEQRADEVSAWCEGTVRIEDIL